MKQLLMSVSVLAAATGAAQAAGLDRSGQSVASIFGADNSASLSFGYVMPSVEGEDIGGAGGSYENVGGNYALMGLSYTNRVNDKFNYTVTFDQPYGADIEYGSSPLASNLGGTYADLNSRAIGFVGRYQVTPRFSVFGGVRAEQIDAEVGLNGVAYRNAIATSAVAGQFNAALPSVAPQLSASELGAALARAQAGDLSGAATIDGTYGAGTFSALSDGFTNTAAGFAATGGYEFEMEADTSPNYLIGMAYEIPDIALRFAATYSFETEHEADTTERLLGTSYDGTVEYVAPASLNLEFQTGIAADTLLLAGYRWTDFSAVNLVPETLGSDLVNLEDGHRYSIGVGRRFSPDLSASFTVLYEPEGEGETVSPLGPTDGLLGLTVGALYTKDNIRISGGLNYSWLGDADAGVADQPVARFEDNSVLGLGLRAEVTF
ncbi:outer membrane protein transport protein [Litorisediminicola beolgyonensis]|uniref:Outer membrane protein transport protein n=1 Tax=Litorisediminicola beolgyonensis TaxID=1173614 RepID=A0ABW3ZF42_9RHOB